MESQLAKHILPRLGCLTLNMVNETLVQEFVAELNLDWNYGNHDLLNLLNPNLVVYEGSATSGGPCTSSSSTTIANAIIRDSGSERINGAVSQERWQDLPSSASRRVAQRRLPRGVTGVHRLSPSSGTLRATAHSPSKTDHA